VWRENPTTDTVSGAGHDERPVQGTGRLHWATHARGPCTLPAGAGDMTLLYRAREPKHVVLDVTDNESPTFTDITGDGKPEIVCSSKGSYGYAEPDWSDPAKPWTFRT
jgi:hypothetical protein